MRGFSFQPTKAKLELCRLCIISPTPICHLKWPATQTKNYTLPNGSWKVFSISNNQLLSSKVELRRIYVAKCAFNCLGKNWDKIVHTRMCVLCF